MNTSPSPNARLLGVAATVVAILVAGYWSGRVAGLPFLKPGVGEGRQTADPKADKSDWLTLLAEGENHHEDLWIYSSGAWLAARGETPYDVAKIHTRVDEKWAGDENLDGNSGFFLTPQALLVYWPWAVMPWEVAKPLWCVFTIGLAAAAGWGMRRLSGSPLPAWYTAAAVVAVLLNPLSLFVLIVGQSTLLVLSCVVLGEAAERQGWRRVGCLLWAVCFIKPHLAFPLLPLAWWLGGWRRAAEVAAWAGGLNILAGVVFFGEPLFVLDYLRYVQGGHQTVEFNRVGVNKQITGWNRLLAAGGGPAVDLGMLGTLASYAGLLVLTTLRVKLAGVRTTREWCFALAGCASLFCCQLLPYELPLLCLGLPYLVGLVMSERVRDRFAAVVLAGTAACAFIPGGDGEWYYQFLARTVGGSWLEAVLQSHRCLGVLATTAGVLVVGPVRR